MIKNIGLLFSRMLVVFIFLYSGINKIFNFAETLNYMNRFHIPQVKILGILAIAVEIIASFLIIIGYKSKYASIVLIGFLIIVTAIFHNVMKEPVQMINFLKNLALIGALLSIVINGPGALSIDKK